MGTSLNNLISSNRNKVILQFKDVPLSTFGFSQAFHPCLTMLSRRTALRFRPGCSPQRKRRWLLKHNVELIVMESTGIYWKAIYSILERTGLNVYVVNARHAKNLPRRKTDVQDSKWLATLARFGLLSPSFIPPEDLRELRLMTRRRIKMQGILSGEKNRLHKILDDAGIRLPMLEIIDDRYKRESTIFATQLPASEWHSRFEDPTLADAIMDRAIHNAYRLELKGESKRKRQKT